jgi:hypothetical protein
MHLCIAEQARCLADEDATSITPSPRVLSFNPFSSSAFLCEPSPLRELSSLSFDHFPPPGDFGLA